jgi:hypothetical protein
VVTSAVGEENNGETIVETIAEQDGSAIISNAEAVITSA